MRGRHDRAATRSGGGSRGTNRVPGAFAHGLIPVVPRGRPSPPKADELDGRRGISRATGLLVPVGAVLTRPRSTRRLPRASVDRKAVPGTSAVGRRARVLAPASAWLELR